MDSNKLEKSILCHLIEDGSKNYSDLPAWINDSYFSTTDNKKLYNLIMKFASNDEPVSYNQFLIDGIDGVYLANILDNWDTKIYFKKNLNKLKLLKLQKDIKSLLMDYYVRLEADELLYSDCANLKQELEEKLIMTTTEQECLSGYIETAVNQIEQVKDGKIDLYLKTGIETLDKHLKLIKSGLHIIAGRPGEGKSVLGFQSALNIAKQKKKVYIFSLEMSGEELARRCISMQCMIDLEKIITGNLTEQELILVKELSDYYKELPIILDTESGQTMQEIELKCKRVKPDFIVLDYLQNISHENKMISKYEKVSDISRRCKILAMQLDIPVMALVQMNRLIDGRKDQEPMLSDLRDSGQIEQDADSVTFIQRNREAANNMAELTIAKQRNGKTGKLLLQFVKNQVRFNDYYDNSFGD